MLEAPNRLSLAELILLACGTLQTLLCLSHPRACIRIGLGGPRVDAFSPVQLLTVPQKDSSACGARCLSGLFRHLSPYTSAHALKHRAFATAFPFYLCLRKFQPPVSFPPCTPSQSPVDKNSQRLCSSARLGRTISKPSPALASLTLLWTPRSFPSHSGALAGRLPPGQWAPAQDWMT